MAMDKRKEKNMMSKKELVDVYANTANGWALIFEDIPEDVALEIWRAGFKTGKNNFSIERKTDRDELLEDMEKYYGLLDDDYDEMRENGVSWSDFI